MVQPKGSSKSGKAKPTYKTYIERIQDLLDKRKSAMQELFVPEVTGVEYSTGKELLSGVAELLKEEGKGRRPARGSAAAGERLRLLKTELIKSQREWQFTTEPGTRDHLSGLAPLSKGRKRQMSGSPSAPVSARKKASSISLDGHSSSHMMERTAVTPTSATDVPTTTNIFPASFSATHKGTLSVQHSLVYGEIPNVPLSFDPAPSSRSLDIPADSNLAQLALAHSSRDASSRPQPTVTSVHVPDFLDLSDEEFYRLVIQGDKSVG